MCRERPFLIPFLALATGLIVADIFSIFLSFLTVAAIFACMMLACMVHNRMPLILCTFLFFFAFGIYAINVWKITHNASDGIQTYVGKKLVTVEGIIVARPVKTVNGSTFVLETDRIIKDGTYLKTAGRLQVLILSGEAAIARGDRVRLTARVFVPNILGLPGEFDYKRYLMFRGISATARIKTVDELLLIRGGEQESILRRIDQQAEYLGKRIEQAVPQAERSSVLKALLLGDQNQIPEKLLRAYTRAGVNHILSISGFHIGIIVYFIAQLFFLAASCSQYILLQVDLRRVILLLSLPAMVVYLLLTGASPATARSVIMLAAFVMALYVERESDLLNIILLAAITLVAINPPTLFDLSFQFSFLALWGIILIAPQIMLLFNKINSTWLRTLLQFLAVSAAASIITAVPSLFFFGKASICGILANLLIVPLLGYGAVLTGFTALMILYIYPPVGYSLLNLAGELVGFSNRLIISLGELPTLTFYGITKVDMLLFVAALSIVTFVGSRFLKITAMLALPAIAIVLHLQSSSFADGRLHLTMLSVGQGESILIHLPNGNVMLLDGGGFLHETDKDFGERVLAPALLKMGVRRIDFMVMTHSHPDHAGGLPFIAENFQIGQFMEPVTGGSGAKYDLLKSLLAVKGITVRSLKAGEKIEPSPGVVFTVLSPFGGPALHPYNDQEENEESLVLQLHYGKTSALLTADAGIQAEERIMRNFKDISAGLLKVGHHGSKYSTSDAWLDRVAPDYALISAGRDNSFGLPSDRTIKALRNRGIQILRTDLDGTTVMSTDGSRWSCTSLF